MRKHLPDGNNLQEGIIQHVPPCSTSGEETWNFLANLSRAGPSLPFFHSPLFLKSQLLYYKAVS